ncbi:EpsG family protein [Flavobacterium sp.]|uniref:EpsG family protein n=1 Tax=Flavobacterium sp. TaxID=239 RepID=UPI002638A6A0|nr:EpsG family protein [Flavobacterium sp.]
MLSFIPNEYYSSVFYHIILVVVLFVFFGTYKTELTNSSSLKAKNGFGIVLMLFIILYMGFRPISIYFGDMVIYNRELQMYIDGAPFNSESDILFEAMKYFYAKYLNAQLFFFTCSFFYLYLLYLGTKKIFKDYWFYAFLMFIIAFTFWAYGVNGIRNGLATSLFVYGISKEKKVNTILILFCSYFIHSSMMIPIIAYLMTFLYSNTKVYIISWILLIPLSLAIGGFFESFFLGLGFGADKLDSYLGEFNQANEGVEISVGFRWDFLLYSASGIFAGWYYIFKKKFEDILYQKIFHIYLISNGLWILIIRANYSNRFAYLSWFILGLVLIYPLLKSELVKNQHVLIGKILIVYVGFTYLMNVILYKS